MRIAIGADHAGFELKQHLVQELEQWGHECHDVGTHDSQTCDYPDFAEAVGQSVLRSHSERGLVICGSGVGASVAANKMTGIRAGLCHDLFSAKQGVEDDNMNVLVLGSRIIDQATARELVRTFLGAVFSKAERHVRRLEKVRSLEERY